MHRGNERLEDLQKRLSAALVRKVALESEIQALSPTGVQSLPFELLGAILGAAEIVDGTSIRNIRLVCSFWNKVALNSPGLWSRIHITVPSTLQSAEWCNVYCIRQMERSKGCLLDISIDLHLRPRERHFLKQLIEVGDISSSSTIQQWVVDGIMAPTDWVEWRGKLSYLRHARLGIEAIFRRCELLWLKPLSTLIGENGDAMRRWRSFDLIHSRYFSWQDDFVKEVFLEGIKIYSSCEVLRISSLRNSWELPLVLVDCQRQKLKVLDLQNVTPQALDISAINPQNLRHISLERCDLFSFQFILSCHNLEHLGIQRYDYRIDEVGESAQGQRDKINPRLAEQLGLEPTTLINLRILEIHQWLPKYLLRFIHAPSLQTLIIRTWNFGAAVYQIPEFNFKNLLLSINRVEFRTVHFNGPWHQLATLRFVFSNASAIDTVLIEEVELEAFFVSMSRLSKEGIRPKRLKYIDVTGCWENGQRQAMILRSVKYSAPA
jgi:hypothetical protein